MKDKRETGPDEKSGLICGQNAGGRAVCDRCRESLALCDIENLVSRKIRGEKNRAAAANAFK